MSLDISKAVNDTEFPAIVRITAQQIRSAPSYYKIGTFLTQLAQDDLDTLCRSADQPSGDPGFALVALAMMLAQAEGGCVDSDDEARDAVSQLILFITMESLYRKGLIDLNHRNLTFAADSGQLEIAKVRPDVEV